MSPIEGESIGDIDSPFSVFKYVYSYLNILKYE